MFKHETRGLAFVGCSVFIAPPTQGTARDDGKGGGALACVVRARGRGRRCLCAPDVSQAAIEPRPPSRRGSERTIPRREPGEQRSWRRRWRRWRRRWRGRRRRWVQRPRERDRGRREHLRLVRRPSEARQIALGRVLNGVRSAASQHPATPTTNSYQQSFFSFLKFHRYFLAQEV